MDYVRPADVVNSMIEASTKKLTLAPRDLLIRGVLSGALLGAATTLAVTGAATTGQPLVGALIFPAALVIIVLLGLELVTGSFAIVPLARLEGRARWAAVLTNWSWVYLPEVTGVVARIVSIPVTLGNLVGGFLRTGLALYATYKPGAAAQAVAAPAQVDAKVLAS
jgi:formate/nitrite transporter FocA (FNT family)